MIYDLPTSVEIGGASYEIRSDYRAVLDILTALSDPGLDNGEKAIVALDIFYPGFDNMPSKQYGEAVKKCFWFINCGSEEDQTRKAPKLMDWEQDFQYIVASINRAIGKDIRSEEYLHWWTFISFYYEIGDCLFAQIVRIRDMRARGKKLDKVDQEFYKRNKRLIDIKTKYTTAEQDLLKEWT